ncbi:MAG: flagellar basal body rod protein FlgB [Lacipirellulaceae bacterium]
MTPDVFSNSTLPMLEQVVQFTEARHGVLAGNLANLNTPGYKTRDLSPEKFEQSLKDAMQQSRQPRTSAGASVGEAAVLAERGIAASGLITARNSSGPERGLDFEALEGVRDSMRAILHHDERDVSLEQQVTEVAKNQSKHNLAVSLIAQQYRLLRSAISEGQR